MSLSIILRFESFEIPKSIKLKPPIIHSLRVDALTYSEECTTINVRCTFNSLVNLKKRRQNIRFAVALTWCVNWKWTSLGEVLYSTVQYIGIHVSVYQSL
jgi:hypothetical protein